MRELSQAKVSSSSVVQQGVPRIRIEVGYVPAPDGGAMLDFSITAITYDIADYSDAGTAVKVRRQSVFYSDWPAGVKTAVRALLKWSDSDAEARSLVDPGSNKVGV